MTSDGDSEDDLDGIPRYISVQDISAFDEEIEFLFSGNQNKFKLVDIYDCRTQKWHKSEISALDKFQQMLQNGNPKWKKKEILRIQEYVQLITAEYAIFIFLCMQFSFISSILLYLVYSSLSDGEVKARHLSRFALELMEYFCKHSELTEVAINDIYNAEPELRKLFGVGDDGFHFSFSIISKLIPSLQFVLLCGLKLEMMEKHGREYIECIRSWIKNAENENVRRIVFRSEMIQGPQDAELAALVQEHRKEFNEMGWALRYRFKNDDYHHIMVQRMERPVVIKLESKSMWIPDVNRVEANEVADGTQSNTYELAVDGVSEFVDELNDDKKLEFALSTVQSTLDEVLEKQTDLTTIIEGIDREKNTIRYRLAAKDEMQLKEAMDKIADAALGVDHVVVEAKVFPIKSNVVSNEESLAEKIKTHEMELMERKQTEDEMKRKLHNAEVRAERNRLEKERMEFELRKREHAQKEERLLTAAAMKEKQRVIAEMERKMMEQQKKMEEEEERRAKEEAERLAEEERMKMEKLRIRVTRIDVLKQYLVKVKQVEQKEVDRLNEIISANAYDSDTLLLSEQWMSSNVALWNTVCCGQFIGSFLRNQKCMLSAFFNNIWSHIFALSVPNYSD